MAHHELLLRPAPQGMLEICRRPASRSAHESIEHPSTVNFRKHGQSFKLVLQHEYTCILHPTRDPAGLVLAGLCKLFLCWLAIEGHLNRTRLKWPQSLHAGKQAICVQ